MFDLIFRQGFDALAAHHNVIIAATFLRVAEACLFMNWPAGFRKNPKRWNDIFYGAFEIGSVAAPGRRKVPFVSKPVLAGKFTHPLNNGAVGHRNDECINGMVAMILAVFFIAVVKQPI